MLIYIGADHRGFELKDKLKNFLKLRGYTVVDLGDEKHDENDDYPLFAIRVAKQVSQEFETAKGILICGSGVGVSVVANKFMHIRAALASSPDQAYDSRNEDDTNILALGANYLDEEAAKKIVLTWLETPYAGEERLQRRLEEISRLEEKITLEISDDENGGVKPPSKISW
ncbi:MAG: RpiB/LacA/LacB family sugar-phosphate isomerase [Minisyncoccia bacterium]|jgi:ribose 5-phosphate isomerase B